VSLSNLCGCGKTVDAPEIIDESVDDLMTLKLPLLSIVGDGRVSTPCVGRTVPWERSEMRKDKEREREREREFKREREREDALDIGSVPTIKGVLDGVWRKDARGDVKGRRPWRRGHQILRALPTVFAALLIVAPGSSCLELIIREAGGREGTGRVNTP